MVNIYNEIENNFFFNPVIIFLNNYNCTLQYTSRAGTREKRLPRRPVTPPPTFGLSHTPPVAPHSPSHTPPVAPQSMPSPAPASCGCGRPSTTARSGGQSSRAAAGRWRGPPWGSALGAGGWRWRLSRRTRWRATWCEHSAAGPSAGHSLHSAHSTLPHSVQASLGTAQSQARGWNVQFLTHTVK